jgi:ABC-type sugar transport system permease subunit
VLYEAAAVDGAGDWARFRRITLPMLRHAILVAVIFRMLDAFRVFDLVYVLTSGGPGTATEPVALYTFTALLQHLRFGYGSAMSVVVFVIAFTLALLAVKMLGGRSLERPS